MKLAALLLLLLVPAAFAEVPNPPVTKIVMRYSSPRFPPDSFAAKPKTLYRAGDTYARIEEEPDVERGIHGLLIVREPDIWMINLIGRQGRHLIDPGPSLVAHHPIMPPDAPSKFKALEFGQEPEFFRRLRAVRLAPKSVDGQPCDASELKESNYRLVLHVRQDTKQPFQLDAFKDGKPDFSVRYLAYETGIAFNPALFEPPGDVTLTEAKSGAR